MQGDLLFYYRKPSMWDQLITWWTHSRFYHVAIDVGNGLKIEALNSGIKLNRITVQDDFARWSYKDHTTDADPKDMAKAIAWLYTMEGHEYGWSDIATAVNPFRKVLYIVQRQHFDCSALAIEFLNQAGGIDMKDLGLDPHIGTPGDLAKFLGVA